MAERGANQRHCGESWRAPSPACAVLEFDRYHWLDPHSRRLCRTIRHQWRHSAGVPAWYRSPDMAAAVRGYCDLPGRCGVRADVLAHHDGSAARPAVGPGPRFGYRISSLSTIPATQPLVVVRPWRVMRPCRRHQAVGFSRLPHLHRIGGRRATGLRVPGSRRRWISRGRQAGRSAGADLCGWAAGRHVRNHRLRACKHLNYIRVAMVDYRDFWRADESFRASLRHYSVGPEGRLALKYWLWFGLVLIMLRLGLALSHDRRDVGRSITLVVAVLVAYAIPTLSPVKSYFLGAMFYGVFIVAMALNLCAIIRVLEGILSRLALSPALRRRLVAGIHLLPLFVVLSLFAYKCLPGRVELATRFSEDQTHDFRTATEKVWSLLQQKSLMPDAQASVQAGKIPVVIFSNPYPVTSATIELYAVQARMPLHVRGEYFDAWTLIRACVCSIHCRCSWCG